MKRLVQAPSKEAYQALVQLVNFDILDTLNTYSNGDRFALVIDEERFTEHYEAIKALGCTNKIAAYDLD